MKYMKGLELSKKFYEDFGKEMLEKNFPKYVDRIAVGLVGHGSECFGFDDEISRDHDFDIGFSLWLTDEDEKEIGFKLMREYNKLLKEHSPDTSLKSIGGNESKGVHTITEFYSRYIRNGAIPDSYEDWLYTPDFYFAEATNGEVFIDPLGEFSKIRNAILFNQPEDVRLKKIASKLLNCAATGQYNYKRCLLHGEKGAAEIAKTKFAITTAELIYLLNRAYSPYYKWLLRGMDNLTDLSSQKNNLESLLTDNRLSENDKFDLIEKISDEIINFLVSKNLVKYSGNYLEPYAYQVNDKIKSPDLRNSHIIQD